MNGPDARQRRLDLLVCCQIGDACVELGCAESLADLSDKVRPDERGIRFVQILSWRSHIERC